MLRKLVYSINVLIKLKNTAIQKTEDAVQCTLNPMFIIICNLNKIDRAIFTCTLNKLRYMAMVYSYRWLGLVATILIYMYILFVLCPLVQTC